MTDLFRVDYGATPIDEDEKAALLPSLSTMSELNEFEWNGIREARQWALSSRLIRRHEVTSEPFIRGLHRRMFRHTWAWAGQYRQTEKTIGVAPHRILTDLAHRLGDVRYWIDNATYPIEEIAVRFHHQLVLIHPFPNGNGRHARLVADIFLAQNRCRPFSWGANVMPPEEARARYLAAVREADSGRIATLMALARTGHL